MTLRADIAPLTDAEKRWLRRLESVLRDMPGRLWLVESADGLQLVDRAAARDVELADGGAVRAGIVLASVEHSLFKVTGVSG